MQKAPRADEGLLVAVYWYVFNSSLQFREFAYYTHLCRIHNNGNEADLSSLDDPIMD